MDGARFAAHCDELRTELVRDFTSAASGSEVAAKIAALGLDQGQSRQLTVILDTVVRDTVYTLLLALDGAASLGSCQQQFTLTDEDGNVIEDIEDAAWQCFHGDAGSGGTPG
jgi:tryptophanyl-tRNA synthetase